MSFWEHLKPSTRIPRPSAIERSPDGAAVRIDWDDGSSGRFAAQLLRQRCPCAACVDEWTSRPTLDPDSVPATIRVGEINAVGNYALSFGFSDGHRTGIYTWELLRKLEA